MRRPAPALIAFGCAAWIALAAFTPACAKDAAKVVSNSAGMPAGEPGGGQVSYGPIAPQPSVQAAMGLVLRRLHEQYGDRPQLGRLFRDRNGQSLSAFFNVTATKQGGQRIAGLAMVSMPAGEQPRAAVISDDAQRFPQTMNSLLQRLNQEVSGNSPAGGSAAGTTPMAGAAHLDRVEFPDGSGSVGLPAGWQLIGAHMGAMEAHGPNGEKLLFGIYIPIMDPSNPRARNMINMETQGGRLPLPGMYVAIPYSTDAGRVLTEASAQIARKQRRQPPAVTVTSVKPGPAQGRASCSIVSADLDPHDGKGVMAMTAQVYLMPPFDATGNWGMSVYQANVPKPLVAQESATVAAIFRSYTVNQQVVNGEVQRQIAASNEFTKSVLDRARSSQAAFEDKLAHDRANEDVRDRSNQAFANILLDQTVVRDSENHVRGTVYNDYADALVKSNPDRFQYVPTQDYLKGIDY